MSGSNKQTGVSQTGVSQTGVSQTTVAGRTDTELSEDLVREYLKNNGDFLQRNPDMFDHLHIAHASGSAVSLVEKQVSVLRERNVDIRHRLKTLTGNARENDKLYQQTRKLVVKLLEAESISALYHAFTTSMQQDFNVEHACMILFGDAVGTAAVGAEYRVDSQDNAKKAIGALLRGHKAVCGALRKEELNYLFPPGKPVTTKLSNGRRSGQAGSAALMPLSNGPNWGLIAVGSSDPNHYSSSMGTLFLTHIAEVIVRLLPRFPAVAQS